MKSIPLSLALVGALVGCPALQTPATYVSPDEWLMKCVLELGPGKMEYFAGMGANDVVYRPKHSEGGFFQKCNSLKPLTSEQRSTYEAWLNDCVSDVLAVRPGAPRLSIDRSLDQNGGLHPVDGSLAIYSHKACRMLKVRVQYDAKNKVESASEPYLGFYIGD